MARRFFPILFLGEGVRDRNESLVNTFMADSIYDIAKATARALRRTQTDAEAKLWELLRDRRLQGKKFLRQHPIVFTYGSQKTFFVADFYCHEAKLVIEVDGKTHDYSKAHDEMRSVIINSLGIRVIRFRNEEVKYDTKRVLDRIVFYLSS